MTELLQFLTVILCALMVYVLNDIRARVARLEDWIFKIQNSTDAIKSVSEKIKEVAQHGYF